MNVFNIYTAYYLQKFGVNKLSLSVELTEDEILEFINQYNSVFGRKVFDVIVYGKYENMIIKGNILNIEEGYNNYYLVDSKNRKFPVYYDGVNTHIMNWEDKKLNTNKLINKCNFRYDFYSEDSVEIDKIVNNK